MNRKNNNMIDIGNVIGTIWKVFIWLMVGWLFKDFLFGRMILYIILGTFLLGILLANLRSEKRPETYKSMADSPLLRSNAPTAPARPASIPVVKTEEAPRVVKIVPRYDRREKMVPIKEQKKDLANELILTEVFCKNCGASELKKVDRGIYSCVYCGTNYRSRDFR